MAIPTLILPFWVPAVVTGGLGVALAWIAFRLGRRLRLLELRGSEWARECANLQHLIAGNGAAISALGQHIEHLSRGLRADRHLAPVGARADSGVGLAIRGARQGASEDDLVADYGMARQEAVLLRRLHGATAGASRERAIP